jgi:hypothetical protein
MMSRFIVVKSKEADYASRCAKQIKGWLNTCTQNHTNDCVRLGSSVLPKRLIHFEDSPRTERLVLVNHFEDAPRYVALSYCWGREENFKTVSTNLPDMERGIPYAELPQTLKDVFQMVRLLGFQYLWIDALCIVQDTTAREWETEASKMGDVYANASLVLSAMASPSVQSGLFPKAEGFSEEQREAFHNIMRTCRTMTQAEWHSIIKDNFPLLCRGWAFQERLLARRIVHFTVMELIWECTNDRRCECEDEGVAARLAGGINNMNSALRECRIQPTPEKSRLMWRECVKSFSKRDLTMLKDRLFAINGIASYIRGPDPTAYNTQYFHGLWKDSMPWDLLWYCDQTSLLKASKSRTPTFSWSSVDCGIEWPTCEHWPSKEKFSLAVSTGTCCEFRDKQMTAKKEAHLCSVEIIDIHTLKIVSRMALVNILPGDSTESQSLDDTYWVVKTSDHAATKLLRFYPDILIDRTETQYGAVYLYLEVASYESRVGVREIGLVLGARKEQRFPQRYERIGLAGNIACNPEDGNDRDWFMDGKCSGCQVILM